MQYRQCLALILSAALLAGGLAGCHPPGDTGGSSQERASEAAPAQTGPQSDPITFVNPAPQHDEILREMADAFTAETGIAVEVVSPAPGQDPAALLRELMEGERPPALFSVGNPDELWEWRESLVNLSAVEDEDLRALHDAVPDLLRLSPEEGAGCGIPWGVEALGYLTDPDMLDDLFGAGSHESLLRDLRACSYEEFTDFCDAITMYRIAPSATEVELCGNTYVFHAVATGRARQLTGVFALPDAGGGHFPALMETALAAVLEGPAAAFRASADEVEALREPLRAYAQAVDYLAAHMAGPDQPAPRSTLSDTGEHAAAPGLLAQGRALFLPGSSAAVSLIEELDRDVAARLEIIPAKLPLADDGARTTRTAPQLNNSLAVRAAGHYVVNAAVPEAEQRDALQLLVWMHRAENLQRYTVNAMGHIPWYRAGELGYSGAMGRSVAAYLEEDSAFAAPGGGAPDMWSETLSNHLAETYFPQPVWTEDHHAAIAEHAVTTWQSMGWTTRDTIDTEGQA